MFEEEKAHCCIKPKAEENHKTPDKFIISSYRSFCKYTYDCINDDSHITINNKTLLELKEKINFYKSTVNELKAKMKSRDTKISKFTEKLRNNLSLQQFSSIEKDIQSIPGNHFFYLNFLSAIQSYMIVVIYIYIYI